MKNEIFIPDFQIDKSYAVMASTQSLGTQNKFFKDNYWYKYDCLGAEGLAEQMVSDLVSCTNLHTFADHVSYTRCRINGKNGCASEHFLSAGEQLVTLAQGYRNLTGMELADKIRALPDAVSRAQYLISFFGEHTGVDITDYLYANIALDYLIRNPDRHFDNLALILQSDGKWRVAPIFDNGQGLGQNFAMTPPDMSPIEADAVLSGATISGSFSEALQVMEMLSEKRLCIDKSAVEELIGSYCPSIAKEYLIHSMKTYGIHFCNYKKEKVSEKDTQEWEYDT